MSPPRRGRPPRCIIMAPTRELAKQVEREFQGAAPGLRTGCYYGGESLGLQHCCQKACVSCMWLCLLCCPPWMLASAQACVCAGCAAEGLGLLMHGVLPLC